MAYIFDPDVLQVIANDAVGLPLDEMVEKIVRDLDKRYPGHILSDTGWVFNNAGGAMGSMRILHASVTEYVLIFGTAIGTEGATGRFAADDWFFMLEGEHWSYAEGDLDRQVVGPGGVSVLKRGESKAYRFPGRAWGLEYARGAIPLMLPFGLADTFSSTLDLRQLSRTLGTYTKHVVHNLLLGKF